MHSTRVLPGIRRSIGHLSPRRLDLRGKEPSVARDSGEQGDPIDRITIDDSLQLVAGADVLGAIPGQIERDKIHARQQEVDGRLPEPAMARQGHHWIWLGKATTG